MTVITCKIPEDLDMRLERAAQERRVSKSVIVRQALESELKPTGSGGPSLYDLMKEGIGCVASGLGDLATNPKHLEGYGRAKRRGA